MTTGCAALTAAAVAVNVAELEPAGTLRETGRVSEELLEDKLTAAPPEGARPVRMTVQVVEPAGARLEGTQPSEFGTTGGAAGAGGIKVKDAFREAPLKEAVTVTVVLALTLEALAVNAAETDPADTTREEGTVRALLLLERPRVIPPLGAAPLRVAVQLAVPGVVIDEGLQASALRVGIEPTVTELPAPAVARDPPDELAAKSFVNPTLRVPSEMEGVMATAATTPSAIAAVFNPAATHTRLPVAAEQLRDLPAAVRDAPGLMENAETDVAGYVKVH